MKIILLLVSLLSACAQVEIQKEDSELYAIPLGSEFVLQENVQVEPLHARAYIQFGRTVIEKNIQEYRPYCELEVENVKEETQIIKPNRFKVIKVVDDDYEASRGVMMASLQTVGGGPLFYGFASEYFLQSERPSRVVKLICLQWDYSNEDSHLTVTEIRRALGTLMLLVLKQSSI